jgi:epoxyqueuosine reductase QueG
VTEIEEFHLRPTLRTLTADDILGMSQEDFSRTFTHSAIKRAKLAGLQRNARALKGERNE